jgi:phosphoenolpyruvate carboxylase
MGEIKHSIVKDFNIEVRPNPHDESGESKVYWLDGMVVFNRNGKLYETKLMITWEISGDSASELISAINSFYENARRTYYLWKVRPEDEKPVDLYGKVIGEVPLVIKDESITKEEYENRFAVKIF